MKLSLNANTFIEDKLQACNCDLGDHLDSDVLFVRSPIMMGLDDAIRREIEGLPKRKKKLSVVLETTGGFVEVTERIADVFRKHYKEVEFIVPNYAYSAGTILCMSGDTIYMDYFSVLGPIDPQVEGQNGSLVPATGYLEKYDELVEKSRNGTITTAEMNYMIHKFDAAELYAIDQARKQSVTLIKKWLVKYKFKDWKTTKTKGLPVDKKMKEDRAEKIADTLNDTKVWHSHGRGIPMATLRSAKMKLQIEDFGKDRQLNKLVKDYYDLASDYSSKNRIRYFLHSGVDLHVLARS
ncbi:MAG: SDH family Clp fold serine proteinase [Rhodospirillales bacterium]